MKLRNVLAVAVLTSGLYIAAQTGEPATPPATSPTAAEPAATPSQPTATPGQPAAMPAAMPDATPDATLAPMPGQPAPSANDSYIIGGNDMLAITVWKEPTLSGTILVRPDGMISIPLVGDVRAAGLTPLHLAGDIATKLKKFVQDPLVSVVVSQIHSKVIYMIGEVNRTGPVDMTPNMTLLEAISSAGGLTQFANKKKIYILRDDAGKRDKIQVHYKEALAGDRSLDLALKPGDTIVIP